jgi:hypothetical protein
MSRAKKVKFRRGLVRIGKKESQEGHSPVGEGKDQG